MIIMHMFTCSIFYFYTRCYISIDINCNREEYAKQFHIANTLLLNLCRALEAASVEKIQTNDDHNHNHNHNDNHTNEDQPQLKRHKLSHNHNITTANTTDKNNSNSNSNSNSNKSIPKRDQYNILDSSFSRGAAIVHIPGTMLSRLTIGGFINALAGQIGGIAQVNHVSRATLIHDEDNDNYENHYNNPNQNNHHNHPLSTKITSTTIPIPTAANLTFTQLHTKAQTISLNIQAQLEIDMLESTPTRIIHLLCPELSPTQVSSIRTRVVDTVLHGRGTNTSSFLQSLEENIEDIPTMAKSTSSQQTHEINKFKKCKVCNNNDQGGNGFVLDKKNGDVICMICGTVICESLMHEGSMYRKFEGEEDRNHHGDVSNPLYSNSYNMGTSLSGVSMSVGAG